MGEKDISEKTLEAYNDVFSDIINVLLFSGERLVKEDELSDETVSSAYKADGKLHAQERDVAKYWKNGLVRIALYGLENQTDIDADMPLRLFSYDGAAYRAQLLSDGEEPADRYPVITLVLYFGHKKHWRKPRTLLECLNVPERLKPYVNDYRMNLFEIAYLDDEVVAKFQSDFRIVADYFVQMRKNKDYEPSRETIRHVHELLQFMAVMTKDRRFEAVNTQPAEGRQTNMCEVLDKIENHGIQKGLAQGLAQGVAQGLAQGVAQGVEALICENIDDGFPKDRIIAKLEKYFHLNHESAEAYYEKYAPQKM